MSTMTLPYVCAQAEPFYVDAVRARDITPAVRHAWTRLRAGNRDLWSPHFDIRMFDILAHLAPHPHVAIAYEGNEIKALLPFQGKKGGLARPLGAPLSDQHNMIAAKGCAITLADMFTKMGMSGFVFSGLLQPVSGALKSQMSICYVADLSAGLDAYTAWRKANWNEQVKKMTGANVKGNGNGDP